MTIDTSFAPYAAYAFLALRIAIAAIFIVHAVPKIKSPGNMAKGMGWPNAGVIFLGLVEFLGALCILLGFYEQWGALALSIIMLSAIYHKIVVWKTPFSAHNKTGWELDLLLLAGLAVIFVVGSSAVCV